MSDTLERFREAGKNGLDWHQAIDAIDASLHDETDRDAFEAASDAHSAGELDRARSAVAEAAESLGEPFVRWVDGEWEERADALDVHQAEFLIEVAAQAAPIEPEEVVAIVKEFCPLPTNALRLAEQALHDFQSIPNRRADGGVFHKAPGEMHAEFLRRVVEPVERCDVISDSKFPRFAEQSRAWPKKAQAAAAAASIAAREDLEWKLQESERTLFGSAQPSPTPAIVRSEPLRFDLGGEPGLLGELARWSVRYAFRPVPEFAPLCALATLAPVFGRRFVTPTNAGLNLYMIALAQTGTGKEALLGAPVAALAAAKLEFLIGAGDFSSDSAIELALRSRPNFLAPIDEVGEWIGAAQHRNAASFSRTIRKSLLELHSKSRPDARWSGKQKVEADRSDKGAEPIYAPHLSILGCATVDGFFGALTEANLSDGLINRFVVIQGGRPGAHNLDAGRSQVPADLAKALSAAYANSSAGNLEPGKAREASSRPNMRVVPWGAGGETAWRNALQWQIAAEDEGRGGIVSRAAENCLKIATIRALARDGAQAVVTDADVRFGWSIVQASIGVVEAGARDNMAGSEFEQLVKAMERAVIEAGAAGIAWSKVLERRGIRQHTKGMVEGARDRLKDRGIITVAMGTGPNGGRPGVRLTASELFD